MKMFGKSLISRGLEEVHVYGQKTRKTVWRVDGQNQFFVKVNGEFVEVFRLQQGFTTRKPVNGHG